MRMLHAAVAANGHALAGLAKAILANRFPFARLEASGRSLMGGSHRAMARDILRQPALKPFLRREVLPGADMNDPAALFDYACRMAKTDHHPVGTCRIGADEMAVVSPDLRLRGIDGLRVCDASVMPRIPSCNTNAPTIMIAEKASDMIRGLHPLAPIHAASPTVGDGRTLI